MLGLPRRRDAQIDQSSVTVQVERLCLGGRPGNGHGYPSKVSNCSDAVGGCLRRERDIPAELSKQHAERLAVFYATAAFAAQRANTSARRRRVEPA